MTRKTNLLTRFATGGVLALSMVISGPVTAQDTETGTPSQLDLGTPADTTPKLGERYSQERIGDWDVACVKTDRETDPCSLLQILTDGSGNPVAEVSVFPLENSGPAVAAGTIIVPLEVLLTAQATIGVDGAAGKRYNYSFCNPVGCVAQIGLTEEDIQSFKDGGVATLTIVPAPSPDQKVVLEMSLKGFTAGFEKLEPVSK